MRRDLRVIVNKVENHYDILLTVPLTEPMLFCTFNPNGGEEHFIQPIEGNEAVVSTPHHSARPYFIIKSKSAPDILAADRKVSVDAVENFRDQGGYIGAEGKTVRWGRFFRGGALAGLSEEEKKYVSNIGFKTILDYRDEHEYSESPDYIPDGASHRIIPAIRHPDDGNNAAVYNMEKRLKAIKTQADADAEYREFQDLYFNLPFENPSYEAMFNALDNDSGVPLYQHCSAGKDRTGVGCAMLLMALGVDQRTAMGDYLLSATYREERNKRFIDSLRGYFDNPVVIKLLHRLLSVEEQLLQSAFDAIESRYGGFESFLADQYKVTPERLAHWRSLHLF